MNTCYESWRSKIARNSVEACSRPASIHQVDSTARRMRKRAPSLSDTRCRDLIKSIHNTRASKTAKASSSPIACSCSSAMKDWQNPTLNAAGSVQQHSTNASFSGFTRKDSVCEDEENLADLSINGSRLDTVHALPAHRSSAWLLGQIVALQQTLVVL